MKTTDPTTSNPFTQPICEQIWNNKYKLTTPNPDIPDDFSVQDTWLRIATACSPDDLAKRKRFYHALEDFKFLPAGRIIAGAGSGRNVTLFNCYVMGVIPDSISGIFTNLREAALTMQQGGGIGYDFSPLRPSGAPVKGVDADASGPLTFMDVWNAMCKTIMSAGSRRGAMMATMRCDHPDIMKYVTAKGDSERLRMFNLSVLATNEFMEAVSNDSDWPLSHKIKPSTEVMFEGSSTVHESRYVYEVIKARDLWETIMESTYNQAEPGVLFIDEINNKNNLYYKEYITCTNPCGEQPLPPYGACLLGSINLVKMIKNPFSTDAKIDYDLLYSTVQNAVEILDNVIDISNFPIEAQKAEALAKRRMGLGITGLADALFMLNLNYGSDDALEIAESVMQFITLSAYETSIDLAKAYGPCPVTESKEDRQRFINSGFISKQMPSYIRDGILKHGIRNALLTSVAPTGTISLYAGNVSSGIEPIFAPQYVRKVLEDDGVTRREEPVKDYAVQIYEKRNPQWKAENSQFFESVQSLKPIDHLNTQAVVQKWVDSSISKTINCPEDISYEDFKDIYMSAWKLGCKGCTTYRPNDITGSVLSIEEDKPKQTDTVTETTPLEVIPFPRNAVLSGQTYKLKWNDSNIYVTINNYLNDQNKVIPFEIFINSKKMDHFQWTVALTRMISAVFRRGGDISFIVDELKSVFDPNGGSWIHGSYVPSLIALLGQTVETHLMNINGCSDEAEESQKELYEEYAKNDDQAVNAARPMMQCTSCNGFNVQLSGGCPTCTDCGHSKCG